MDTTSEALLKFINQTESIAEKALKFLDKNVTFHIIPSIDIGVPYDVDRLAGGFPTGVYIEWNCNIPIIPIDTTVNCCTASVFFLSNHCDDESFKNNLMNVNKTWKESSYQLNFNRGNHFIALCSDCQGNRFLVMHSTAKEFARGYNGLYPIKGNWYYDKIKIYEDSGRYFRYLQGNEAELFIKTAMSLNKYNEIRHENIAYSLLSNCTEIFNVRHFHHYGMNKPEAIQIGCYTVSAKESFPIFSKPGYSIDIFKLHHCSHSNTNGKFIVPHGWGKKFTKKLDISFDLKKNIIKVGDSIFNVFEGESLYDMSDLEYRDFEERNGENGFYKYFATELSGEVEKVLYQNISLTSMGIQVIQRRTQYD